MLISDDASEVEGRLRKGARKIVNQCLAVAPGETFLVVADRPNRVTGEALLEAGLARGADASLVLIEQRKAHAEDPPRPVALALLEADAAVLATVFSLSNSEARRRATAAGTRVISLPGCREETLVSGAIEADFEQLKPIVHALGAILSTGRKMHVANPAGTELTIQLCGRPSVDQTAMAPIRGSWAPAPNVETAVGPCETGVDGRLVVDGAVIPGGIPRQPVTVTLKAGRITAIEGGEDADRLRRLLADFQSPAMYQAVEVGIGLNPCSRIGRGLMAEDESQFGTVHLGFGEGRTFGLDVVAPSHVDLVIRQPIVEVDGREIVRDERLSESLARELRLNR